MKVKTDKIQWVIWLGLMVEYTFAFAFSQYRVISLVLLYFGLAGVLNFVLVHFWSTLAAGNHRLLLIVWPCVGLLCFADLVFGFNTVLPFVVLTVLMMAAVVLFAMADEAKKPHTTLSAVLILSVATVAVYLLLTMPYGIFS